MNPLSHALAFISMPGGGEWLVIAVIGLLIFGKRLPEVGKSLGKSVVEFKKGLRSIGDDPDQVGSSNQAEMLPPPSKPNTPSSTPGQPPSPSGPTPG